MSGVDSAESHMVSRVPVARMDDSVGYVTGMLPGNFFDSADMVYVLDGLGRLQGRVTMTALLGAPATSPIREIMERQTMGVEPGLDQEEAALIAARFGLTSVPVTDRDRRFLGAIPTGALMEIMAREHIEDINRLVGISKENDRARRAIDASPSQRLKDRLPWLLLGLLGSMAATLLVARFSDTMEKMVAVAFFMPVIVYLADAIGTQTEAVTVRGLSLSRSPFSQLVSGELKTGLLIGLILGSLIFPFALIVFGDLGLAAAAGISTMLAGGTATSIGFLLPWIFSRMGMDPALGSGPMATILQDILSLLVYFIVVTILVF